MKPRDLLIPLAILGAMAVLVAIAGGVGIALTYRAVSNASQDEAERQQIHLQHQRDAAFAHFRRVSPVIPLEHDAIFVDAELRIIQIVDENTVLAELTKKNVNVLANGWGTDGIVDGEIITVPAAWVSGTQDYTTVLGANERVYVVEPIELEGFRQEWLASLE